MGLGGRRGDAALTHSLPGQMPLQVTVRDAGGNVVERRTRA
ncbi:MAG TPA: hypothetical protein VLL75_15885 [Vicinamibacteria bacterium]|nr:hypothetical protein [Vicinamibacteria bacterium]